MEDDMLNDATPQFPPLEITEFLEKMRKPAEYLQGMRENCEAWYDKTGKPPVVYLGNGAEDGMSCYLIKDEETDNWNEYDAYSYVNNKENIKQITRSHWTKASMTLDQLEAYGVAKGY